MASSITTTEILKSLAHDDGRVFSIVFVSYDERRKTGGKLRKIDRAISLSANPYGRANLEKKRSKAPTIKPRPAKRYTRKIRPVDAQGNEIGHIITIHPELILFFDGVKHLPT